MRALVKRYFTVLTVAYRSLMFWEAELVLLTRLIPEDLDNNHIIKVPLYYKNTVDAYLPAMKKK